MKRKRMYTLALTAALGWQLQAQLTPPMFNTASEPPAYTTYRPYGMNDVAWTVAQTPVAAGATPPTNASAYVSAVSQQAVGSWFDPHPSTIPNAGWITYPNTCPSQPPGYHGCLTPTWGVDQWYKIEFFICCEEDFCIDLEMWADNRIQEIYVNTTAPSGPGYWVNPGPDGGDPGTYQGYLQGNSISRSVCENWKFGLNYMIMHVISDGTDNSDYAGLLVNCTHVTPCNGEVILTDHLRDEDREGGEDKRVGVSTGNKNTDALEPVPVLGQNIPNPFSESTLIGYSIPQGSGSASLVIRNLEGVTLSVVNIDKAGPGSYVVERDQLRNGAYSYSLIIDDVVVASKIMLKQ